MTHPRPRAPGTSCPTRCASCAPFRLRLFEVFERFGYGEVATPTIEYDEVLARAGEAAAPPAHRFFDESGDLVAMRSDMTIPIARLVATRFADDEGPFRFSYSGTAYRAVRPQRGQMREFMQAGVELIGEAAPGGTAEMIEVLSAALDAVGLTRAVIGLGDADLFSSSWTSWASPATPAAPAGPASPRTTWSAWRPRWTRSGLDGRARETLLRLPNFAAGRRSSSGPRAGRRGRRARDGAPGGAPTTSSASAASPTASSSTSGCCATSATTPARSSRSTTRPLATCSAAAAATTS